MTIPDNLENNLVFKSSKGKQIRIVPDDVQILYNCKYLLVKVLEEHLSFYIFDLSTGDKVFYTNTKFCSKREDPLPTFPLLRENSQGS